MSLEVSKRALNRLDSYTKTRDDMRSIVESLDIKTDGDLENASVIYSQASEGRKEVDKLRKELVMPIKQHAKKIDGMFMPVVKDYEGIRVLIQSKMSSYITDRDNKAKEKEAKLAEKAASGDLTLAQAAASSERIKKAPTKISTPVSTVRTVEKKVIEIEDANAIPREYLVPDMVAIRKDALAGKEIKGVVVKTVKTVRNG